MSDETREHTPDCRWVLIGKSRVWTCSLFCPVGDGYLEPVTEEDLVGAPRA